MSCNLQLQRNSEVFYSTVNLFGGALVTDMRPTNTWKIEILAGYAVSQAAATQDITASESGLDPDRSITRFNTSINPVEWNFQAYLRPTGVDDTTGNTDSVSVTSNAKPVADWFLWQGLISNTAPATGAAEQSAWENGGSFRSLQRVAAPNVATSRSNFAVAQENFLYFKMDNVVYQVSAAAINEGSVDAAIDGIATSTWTGFGTDLIELRGANRNNAVSVFGGVLNDGSTAEANSNATAISAQASYHPWASYNVAGTVTTSSFIRNKLSSIDLNFTPDGGSNTNYTFPVTALTWGYNNNITYLIPEELATLNSPVGNFTGARQVTSTLSAYLRVGSDDTAQLLKDIIEDPRTSHSDSANANVKVGGASAPYVSFYMPASQFDFPTHSIEDIITVQFAIQAQESATNCGLGDEVTIFAKQT